MRRAPLLVLVAAALALPAPAGAAPSVTAVRVGDHPGYVRAVVDLAGGSVLAGEVFTTDPRPADGLVKLKIERAGIGSAVEVASGEGLRVRVTPTASRLRIGIRAAAGRFKYVSYTVLGGRRLAIDLWKSAPPSAAAEVRRGRAGCLTLDSLATTEGSVLASGDERALFEHQLVTLLRARDGRVLARRPVLATGGTWRARLSYAVAHRQAGTFEAIATSAKDGSLVCLVQARVVLLDAAPHAPSS